MVDSANGIGQSISAFKTSKAQPVSAKKTQETENTRKSEEPEEIKKKKKDLSAQEAEDISRETRQQLEKSGQTLGLGNNFDERV